MNDLQEENRMLASELNRVEEMLSASRAERDELGIKYNALSERVSRVCLTGCCCCCCCYSVPQLLLLLLL